MFIEMVIRQLGELPHTNCYPQFYRREHFRVKNGMKQSDRVVGEGVSLKVRQAGVDLGSAFIGCMASGKLQTVISLNFRFFTSL